MMKPFLLFIFFAASLVPAHGLEIQKVESASGIQVWLVENHTQPLIALSASFGKPPDPRRFSGTSALMASLLDEGAGDLNWQAFKNELERLSIKMSFSASHESLSAQMMTLTKNQTRAFELFALALAKPTFAEAPFKRLHAQFLTIAKNRKQNLSAVGREQFYRHAFGTQPYAYPVNGIAADLKKMSPAAMRRHHKRVITRANLHISVVGAIDAKTLALVLDKVFAPLPAGKKLRTRKVVKLQNTLKPPKRRARFIKRKSEQSYIYFALPGLKRDDPDFISYYVMNHILGGGQTSRLWRLARERYGLVYSISTQPLLWRRGGFLVGTAATHNSKRAALLKLIRRTLARTRARGVSEAELALAKTYLIGSYGLAFDTSLAVAENLTYIQRQGLGIHYLTRRVALINAVTTADIKKAVEKFLAYDRMSILVVGGVTNARKTRNIPR